jgi:hypothetical protein
VDRQNGPVLHRHRHLNLVAEDLILCHTFKSCGKREIIGASSSIIGRSFSGVLQIIEAKQLLKILDFRTGVHRHSPQISRAPGLLVANHFAVGRVLRIKVSSRGRRETPGRGAGAWSDPNDRYSIKDFSRQSRHKCQSFLKGGQPFKKFGRNFQSPTGS